MKIEITPEDVAEAGKEWANAILASMTPEDRLAGLKPEDRLAGLKPEEILERLKPEEIEAYLRKVRKKKIPRKKK